MSRLQLETGYVSAYEFDLETAKQQADIYRFQSADLEWLQFVVGNRRGEELFKAADMHIGPVADDTVCLTICANSTTYSIRRVISISTTILTAT